jgi:hypothetical protein
MQIEPQIIEKGIVQKMQSVLESKISANIEAWEKAQSGLYFLIQQALLKKDQTELWAVSAQFTEQCLAHYANKNKGPVGM